LRRSAARGTRSGLAAYAAFGLARLAVIEEFVLRGAVVDLAWGTVLTGSVNGAASLFARATS
jgi:uncharacterized membrane protein